MGHPKESKTSARKLRARDLEAKALELRKAGLPYRKIGKELGVTMQGAALAVKRILDREAAKASEVAKDVIALEVARLDDLLRARWAAAMQGDNRAVDRVLRIMERRARLLGLDAVVALAASQEASSFSATLCISATNPRTPTTDELADAESGGRLQVNTFELPKEAQRDGKPPQVDGK